MISLFMFSTAACERQTSQSIQTDTNLKADLFQIDGCQRGGLQKRSDEDSCFVYNFNEQTLSVDFCVTANCCPDSDRFIFDYTVEKDLIHVTVTDTADNLCRCICPYMIHTEFTDLPLDAYRYKVDYDDQTIYNKQVSR